MHSVILRIIFLHRSDALQLQEAEMERLKHEAAPRRGEGFSRFCKSCTISLHNASLYLSYSVYFPAALTYWDTKYSCIFLICNNNNNYLRNYFAFCADVRSGKKPKPPRSHHCHVCGKYALLLLFLSYLSHTTHSFFSLENMQ